MPIGDWQFWIVTLAAAGGAWLLYRTLRPKKKRGSKASLTISASGKR